MQKVQDVLGDDVKTTSSKTQKSIKDSKDEIKKRIDKMDKATSSEVDALRVALEIKIEEAIDKSRKCVSTTIICFLLLAFAVGLILLRI